MTRKRNVRYSDLHRRAPHGLTGLPFSAVSITTARLCLRPLRRSDLDDVHAYQKREDVVRYLNWEVRDHDQSAEHLESGAP